MALSASAGRYFDVQTVAPLSGAWSLAFLPGGNMLVSERPAGATTELNPTAEGHIRLVTPAGVVSAALAGVPGNVGVLDIELDPNYANNRTVYFSFIERDPAAPRIGRNAEDTRVDPAGIVVARAVLDLADPAAPRLTETSVLWKATKVVSHPGSGEPGGRLAFSPDGRYLFIASGDRQEFAPVQSLENSLGKIIRLNADGSVPADNPYVGVAGALPEIWSLGHRNPYGLTFDGDGVLWENEMGPKGGDELNVVTPRANYGWPNVSYGNFYDDGPIAKPAPGDGFAPSPLTWTPVIAPSGMIAYSGDAFPQFRDDLIVSGLQSKGLVVVGTAGSSATELTRIDLGARARDVAQGPDGSLWVLTDGADGRLLHLKPIAALPTSHAGDFDGDGRSDILWRHDGGLLSNWLGTSDGGFAANDAAALTQVDTNWSVASLGDFDGDGRSDILWRHDDGMVSNWLGRAGGGFQVNDANAFSTVGIDWQIVGTGDFDGDGRDDILWRNVDGALSNWLGQPGGGFRANDANAMTTGIPAGWWVNAIGDVNGDGRDDIVWRNDDGSLSDWLGTARGGFVLNDTAALSKVSVDWHIVGVGDFNGDGFGDLLWRNDDGMLSNWLGDAAGGFAANDANAMTRVDTAWQVAGVGDYNGDGRDDVLWRHVDGDLSDWLGTATGSLVANDANAYAVVANSWNAGPIDHLML